MATCAFAGTGYVNTGTAVYPVVMGSRGIPGISMLFTTKDSMETCPGLAVMDVAEYTKLTASVTQPSTSPPDTSPGSGGSSSGVSAGVSAFIVVCVGMFFMGYMTRVVLKSVIRFFNGSPDDF